MLGGYLFLIFFKLVKKSASSQSLASTSLCVCVILGEALVFCPEPSLLS